MSWIDEKSKKLEKEVGKTEVTSLEDKIKKLQKHQAFQAELVAHEGKIKSIQRNGTNIFVLLNFSELGKILILILFSKAKYYWLKSTKLLEKLNLSWNIY